jgi:hypothetical protein
MPKIEPRQRLNSEPYAPQRVVFTHGDVLMTNPKLTQGPQPPPANEPVQVTIRPLEGAGNGVFKVTVQVDDHRPGTTIVRTSPRGLAFAS